MSAAETVEGYNIRIGSETIGYVYIDKPSVAKQVVIKLLNEGYPTLGFDIETGKQPEFLDDPEAGLDPRRSFISLIQLYDPLSRVVYMFDMLKFSLEWLKPLLRKKRLVAHNAIFDQGHLAHAGYPNLNIDCTMIMYNMYKCAEYIDTEDEESNSKSFGEDGDGTVFDFLSSTEKYGASLSAVTSKLLGIYVPKELQRSNWTDRPLDQNQLIYAAKDAYFTFEIGKILSRKLVENGMSKVYKLYRDTLHPVVAMQLNGNNLDIHLHVENISRWKNELDINYAKVIKYFGTDTNIKSPDKISRWLEKNLPIETTLSWPRSEKTGKLKSDAKTLKSYSSLPFVTPLLDYKKKEKLLSTYGESLIKKINPFTGRLHGSYTIGYTATGRLSSRSPNLQNGPRDKEFRRIFNSAPECQLVGADYNQIELRVAAELSRDRRMLQAYKNGEDLHRVTAASVLGKPLNKVTTEDRQLAKSLNFGLLYGLGPNGLINYALWNYGVSLTEQQAYTYYSGFFMTYSGYADWQEATRKDANMCLYTRTVMGKTRKLHKDFTFTRSVNHPVQGTAAEIVQLALVKLYKAINQKPHINLINCVHDEIILEVNKNSINEAKIILQSNMEEAMLDVFPNATLNNLVAVTVADNWAELK